MDNWFTSFPLMHELLHNYGLTALGTVKKNKPQVPPLFITTKNREIQSSFFAFQKECTLVSYVPKKGKVVLLASTMHHDAKIDNSTGIYRKPEIITDYNRYKCGVDVVDELCSTYSVSRSTKRWPLVLFFGLLNIGGINAYVIVKANKENRNEIMAPRRDCLKELALALVTPQISNRSFVVNLPAYIKKKINFILGDDVQTENNQPSISQSRSKTSASRCEVCFWKTDRKTKTCSEMICREHTVPICDECYEKCNKRPKPFTNTM